MTSALVECQAVSLTYRRGAVRALDDLNVQICPGIVGLVGANGAGKTSFLRLLAGEIAPTRGHVTIGGLAPSAYRTSRGFGSIPDQPRFPSYLTVGEFLGGLRALCGASATSDAERALADEFDIGALGDRLLGSLSLGQKRRVELVAALIGDPDLVLLDEPTNGLDPLAVAALRRGLLASRRPGRLLLVSSHHLDELQRVTDHVLILSNGRLVGDHAAEDVRARAESLESLFLAAEAPHGR